MIEILRTKINEAKCFQAIFGVVEREAREFILA